MIPLDFEILSKLMRYVFTFLGVVIVLRSFGWLRKDRRATARRIKALPDAGTIGVLTVLQGSSELKEGDTIPVPPEGVLGFVRTCDIVVPVTDVVAQHLDFAFRNGKGLYIYPRRGCPVAVDGVTINSRADSRRSPVRCETLSNRYPSALPSNQQRAFTSPSAATPVVISSPVSASFATASSPRIRTCPRRTVSPGFTAAVPDFTFTAVTTPSRSATRSRAYSRL